MRAVVKIEIPGNLKFSLAGDSSYAFVLVKLIHDGVPYGEKGFLGYLEVFVIRGIIQPPSLVLEYDSCKFPWGGVPRDKVQVNVLLVVSEHCVIQHVWLENPPYRAAQFSDGRKIVVSLFLCDVEEILDMPVKDGKTSP